MFGLILKDFINLKKQAIMLFVMLIAYFLISLQSGNSSFFSSIIATLCAILPITCMSYDERASWDKYALTMPITRTTIVLSKYILCLLFSGIAIIINCLFTMLSTNISFKNCILSSLAFCGMGLVFFSIIFPIIFKLGVEKARIALIIVVLAPFFLLSVLTKSGLKVPSKESLEKLIYVTPFIVLLIFVISILISLNIYKKKEF